MIGRSYRLPYAPAYSAHFRVATWLLIFQKNLVSLYMKRSVLLGMTMSIDFPTLTCTLVLVLAVRKGLRTYPRGLRMNNRSGKPVYIHTVKSPSDWPSQARALPSLSDRS